jgi:hypothetical protein
MAGKCVQNCRSIDIVTAPSFLAKDHGFSEIKHLFINGSPPADPPALLLIHSPKK